MERKHDLLRDKTLGIEKNLLLPRED